MDIELLLVLLGPWSCGLGAGSKGIELLLAVLVP
jgi:hypothetical protein